MTTTTDLLPLAEQQALDRCEAIIARGVQTFIDVGEALAEIRDGRLYRASFDTFETYCRDKWGIGGSRARQLIGAAGVARHIESVTTVTLSNEAQARPLVGKSPDQQVAAFNRATELAGDGPRTAAHVQQAVNEIAPPAAPALSDILLRLSAHGYDQTGAPRTKGMTTFYTFRDRASDLDDDSIGVLEMAEGELSFWLADLDASAARQQAAREQFQDARDRFAALGWSFERIDKEFVLSDPQGKLYARTKQIDSQLKTLATFEAGAAKRAQAAPPPDEHADDLTRSAASDREAHIAREESDAQWLDMAEVEMSSGNHNYARQLLGRVSEASAWRRDQLLARLPRLTLPIDLQKRLVAAGAAIMADGTVIAPKRAGEQPAILDEAACEAAIVRWSALPAETPAAPIGDWWECTIPLGRLDRACRTRDRAAALHTAFDLVALFAGDDPRTRAAALLIALERELKGLKTEDQEGLSMAISDLNECREGTESTYWLRVGSALLDMVADDA